METGSNGPAGRSMATIRLPPAVPATDEPGATVSVVSATTVAASPPVSLGAPVPAVVLVLESLPQAAMRALIAGMANTPVANWRRVSRPFSCEAIRSAVSFSTWSMNVLPCSSAVLETGFDNVVGDPGWVNGKIVIPSTTAPGIRSIDEAIHRRVAARGVPAMATRLVEPPLDLHAIGVGEHPCPIQVAAEIVGEVSRWFGEFAAEAELLDRPRAAVRTRDRQHQRVPVEP